MYWCKFEMPKWGQKIMISKSKGWEMRSGPLSIPTFQNNFVLQDLKNVLQFASESCYKLRRPSTIITKCCNPCYKMRSFHLLQNAATLITKCATYYKMPQPLLQNAQLITKCVVITKCRRTTTYWKRTVWCCDETRGKTSHVLEFCIRAAVSTTRHEALDWNPSKAYWKKYSALATANYEILWSTCFRCTQNLYLQSQRTWEKTLKFIWHCAGWTQKPVTSTVRLKIQRHALQCLLICQENIHPLQLGPW